ncbi:MAG: hypothetical protein IIC67_00200 [Thaumarchaeota archaeon]|nr:hypothetical protein [Nitrososphaerota archaeon]
MLEDNVYLVRILSDTISKSNHNFIVWGVDNKLAAITHVLRNRGSGINGDYSIRADKLNVVNSNDNSEIQMIELKNVSQVATTT